MTVSFYVQDSRANAGKAAVVDSVILLLFKENKNIKIDFLVVAFGLRWAAKINCTNNRTAQKNNMQFY